MNIPILTLLLLANSAALSRSDPCRTNFGDCDRRNGLCWGTSRNTHFCTCRAGYVQATRLRIHVCVDVDECSTDEDSALCPDNAVCENTIGSYTCRCRCGFVMDYTGQNCLEPRQITGLCEPPSSCDSISTSAGTPTVAFDISFRENYITNERTVQTTSNPITSRDECDCESGFTMNNCGFCIDIDECILQRPCTGFTSTCVNTEGSYYCECGAGYVLGPCRIRCYRRGETIPIVCEEQDLEGLESEDVSGRTFVRPVSLPNWKDCAPGVENGQRTRKRVDLDHDGTKEMLLVWICYIQRLGRRLTSVLRLASESRATWSDWSCWTACKATCWGGLQTRVRTCLSGIPGISGCKGKASDKRECYTGDKCEFRYRKNANALTITERNDLLQAMERYKEDTSAKGFFNAAASHGWPYQCNRQMCCPHGAKLKFLSWHRSIMLNYEEGLSRYMENKSLGIPYWDWLGSDKNPPDVAWRNVINGRPNPFASMTVRIDWPVDRPGRDIERDARANIGTLRSAADRWNDTVKLLNNPYSMHEFAESLEAAHDLPHVSVCAGCRFVPNLGSLAFAGFDPLFLFHHSQIDHLWAISQRNLATPEDETAWTLQVALEAQEEEGDFGRRHMPFANKTLNAFPIVQAVNTMRDSYHYEELTGIKYDTLENDGFPPSVTARVTRPAGLEVLFIGHYLQSVEENVYVNYYNADDDSSCSLLSNPVAGTLLLGVTNEFEYTIPRLTPTTRFRLLNGEYPIKACYTASVNCRSRCPEVTGRPRIDSMPDPFLVHYLPNQPVDVYKFQWANGRRFPAGHVNLDAGFQWIYFFGNEASNILQVRSRQEWQNCDAARGRRIGCSAPNGNACLLRSGRYYLIDGSRSNCRAGMRLQIVARK